MKNEPQNPLKRILYVDDDDLSLESIQMLLKNEYNIDTAKTSDEALELAKKNPYEAVLMDIGLGYDTNGVKLTEEIRKIERYRQIPFIAITAYASLKDKQFFLSNGLDYYLAKPFFKKDILAILDEVFNKSNNE